MDVTIKRHPFGWLRLGLGLLGVIAITTQLLNSITQNKDIANFFSFFTIQSNVLAALLLITVGLYQIRGGKGKSIAYLRGAITLYMTMTGIIYAVLLSGNEAALQTTIPWVNVVLHYVLPVVLFTDWMLFPPTRKVEFRKALWWLAFPIIYLTYSFVRGEAVNWYPYPFINPTIHDWGYILVMSLGIAVFTIVLAWLLTLRTTKALPKER